MFYLIKSKYILNAAFTLRFFFALRVATHVLHFTSIRVNVALIKIRFHDIFCVIICKRKKDD